VSPPHDWTRTSGADRCIGDRAEPVQRLTLDLATALLADSQPLADPLVTLRHALIEPEATHLSVALGHKTQNCRDLT
jgi:hypothetical protein